MDEGIAGAVAAWDERPFSGGYRGLQELVDREFSGAVEAAGCWILLINGRVIGVFEEYEGGDGPRQEPADIEHVEGGSGTAYEAPHDALPLLFTMQARGGEVIARNPTKDRPLEEIHQELKQDGFTGYLVLSEHVLSGEYYVVYQNGRSMSVAFIGGARRLKTDEEAFERAKKEVGIYEVCAVQLEVVDVPEPADDAGGDAGLAPNTHAEDADESDLQAAPETLDAPDETKEAYTGDPTSEAADDPTTVADSDPDAASEQTDDIPVAGTSPTTEPANEPDGDEGDQSGTTDEEVADKAPAVADLDDRDNLSAEATAAEPGAEPAASDEPTDIPDAATVTRLDEQLDELAKEQSELAATVEQLRARLDEVVGAGGDAFEPSERRSPSEALAETTLLVRYRSGSETTLKTVHEGGGDHDALASNLKLERVTPFDAEETAVDGLRFEEFLQQTVAYRFVAWLITEFPFEVRATEATGDLVALYDALPEIDRATFDSSATEAAGPFDVVFQNQSGDPLVVVTVDEGAGPPTREASESFIQRASDAETETGTLAAAFLVTTGYVNEDALGPVRDATRTGMLSRGRRKSYVNLSSGGFHLCLVEASGESFHLAAPDL